MFIQSMTNKKHKYSKKNPNAISTVMSEFPVYKSRKFKL